MHNFNCPKRILSVCAFSFAFAYLLSFLFEGQVLYGLVAAAGRDAAVIIPLVITAHFLGLFTCGFFCKSLESAKKTMVLGLVICLLLTVVFFFDFFTLWLISLVLCGYFLGWTVAAWAYFLKAYVPKNERIKTCADVLIYSNLLMIGINVAAISLSPFIGLVLAMACLVISVLFTLALPAADDETEVVKVPASVAIGKPMAVLFLFVSLITVDSGLMYQVINPGFAHLTWLTSWYWAVPYIAALLIMRNLPLKFNRSVFLYIGMAMIICAFLGFMLLGRETADYLIVDTLMLGACGIFDLFWWSIIGETLDYTKNPAKIFGIGLSANVFGVLCGDLIGFGVTGAALPEAQIAVIALCVVCVTLILLPPLNRQFVNLLKTNTYLSAYAELPAKKKEKVAAATHPLVALTERETELLGLLLEGKSNKEIAAISFITENTVKTHLKSIYSKYAVTSRAELISLLLRSQERYGGR